MSESKYFVFYNSDEDQLYITTKKHTAWTNIGGRIEATVSILFCPDCKFWHLIGEL